MVYKALLIAVDQYLNTSPLPNTVNDVSEIKRLLLEPPSFFKKENVEVFQGNIAKRNILHSALTSFFEDASPNDILFLFWAGHGFLHNNEGYFVPFDGDAYNPEDSMIKMTDVRDLIDHTIASTVLAFFDTCHSGAIARNIQHEMVRGLEVKGSGKVLIAACTSNQWAWDRNGHGAFTDYLIRGLEGEAADANGEIDVYNLYSYVSKKVAEEFKDQTPVMKSTLTGKPLLLKRVVKREGQSFGTSPAIETKIVNSSGAYFWLGDLTCEYDEYREPKAGTYELVLKNPDNKTERTLKLMQQNSGQYALSVRNFADMVTIENIRVESQKEDTTVTITLVSLGDYSSFTFPEMSINLMGKRLSADDIAMLRVRRILFGEELPRYDHSSVLLESMIINPSNAKIQVISNLLRILKEKGYTMEQIRGKVVEQLILTGTLQEIEDLTFVVENGVIKKVCLQGYRPKYYANVEPTKIEINESVNI
ncbi:caspase family protein [Anoxybacillus kestanbolensis]|uniref:caspase family protein n=1 Tax=Anoxybacillus kestanbolensis TaxID=227476 RepID=UPI003D1BF784